MVSGTVNPVNEIHAFPRASVKIYFTYTESEIVWRFALYEKIKVKRNI